MSSPSKPRDLSEMAADAARYGQRLAEFGVQMAALPGDDAARARELLGSAADAAREASDLMSGHLHERLRLHLNFAGQSTVLTDAAEFLLESARGDSPVVVHHGASQHSLPFGVRVSSRLVNRLRALLGADAAWTEAR
jgi:hypothetical protein